jgi:hypothetical protein
MALLALAFLLYFSTKNFLMFYRSGIIALGDSGTVLWIRLYWFLHAIGQVAILIPASVVLLKIPFLSGSHHHLTVLPCGQVREVSIEDLHSNGVLADSHLDGFFSNCSSCKTPASPPRQK